MLPIRHMFPLLIVTAVAFFELQGVVTVASADTATTRPTKAQQVEYRHVEVTLLGSVNDVKGFRWPTDSQGGHTLSAYITEPCDLTLHLPSGKTLSVKSHPILIVSRAFEEETVVTVRVPPADERGGWMNQKAAEMERLLVDWRAVPSERMRETINEFRCQQPPGPSDPVPIAGIERVGGATLDPRSGLLFELVLGRGGKWNMIAVISAGQADRDRIFRMGQARLAATGNIQATQPATQPSNSTPPPN